MKKKPLILTPLQEKALKLVADQEMLTLAEIQRKMQVTFCKAVEIAEVLFDAGLVKSNVRELKIEKL